MTRARDLSKLLSTSNSKIAGDQLDVSFENIDDTGTEGTKVATGTTAQRGSTTGQTRFNTTTNLFEYYDGTSFKQLDSAPLVSSVSPTNLESSNLPADLTITGVNFKTGVTVKFIDNSGTETNSSTVTRTNSTELVVNVPDTLTSANEPFDVKVTNIDGLSNTLADAFNIDAAPTFDVASGSLGTLENYAREASNLTAITASDDENDSITFSITTGSAPAGLTLGSDGTWSGTADAVSSDTTSTFTVTASDGTNTSTRQYSITVNAPTQVNFGYTGSLQSWSIPSGVTSVQAYVWGAGGGGGNAGGWSDGGYGGGGGSAYGVIDVSSLSSLKIVVGQSGVGQDGNSGTSTRTAYGGGAGTTGTADNRYAGGGAGLSGIFQSSFSHGNSIIIAGGGGGGGSRKFGSGSASVAGGAGGGTTGRDGSGVNNNSRGRGGTQSAGGAAGSGNTQNAGAGSALQGGSAYSAGYGGGGGGGYYGGSGGSYLDNTPDANMAGGGGGSGYIGSSLVSNGVLYQGSGQTPGNSGSSYRAGAGDGGGEAATGDNGRVVILY